MSRDIICVQLLYTVQCPQSPRLVGSLRALAPCSGRCQGLELILLYCSERE